MELYWLDPAWLAANWQPLLLSLVIGFILGWLLLGLPPRGRARKLEESNAELEAKVRKQERELGDARKESQTLRGSLTSSEDALNLAKNQLAEAADAKAALEEQLAAANGELDNVKANLASALAEGGTISAALDRTTSDFAQYRRQTDEAIQTVASKDSALQESFNQIHALRQQIDETNATIATLQADLAQSQAEQANLSATKADLEKKLVRAREDVAGELAVFSSTMIKMKDDALNDALARVASLSSQIDALRAKASSSNVSA